MKNRPELYLCATAIVTTIGCITDPIEPLLDEEPEALAACPVPIIDIDRSLFVSPTAPLEQAELRARFSVPRIMDHLLASSGAARPASGTALFQRWWDTQNSSASAVFPDNPHCDDSGQTINGFPVACPRNEGALATALPASHFPVALIYRPDLAPLDGRTCGEARIVIAKPSDGAGRNLPIFEASIPNPSPSCGLAGCRKIAQFWAQLSSNASFSQRLDALERFYFTGLTLAQDGVAMRPVLDASNLGVPDNTGARRGQIRTNQFMTGPNPRIWQLREFKLNRACTGTLGCKLFFEPVSDKTNPWGALFNDNAAHALGPAFRGEFLDQVQALSPQDVNAIGMSTTNSFNAGQSNAQGLENEYEAHFLLGNPLGFRRAIIGKLLALGVPLTAENIVARATTQSCGGCHQLSNNDLLGGLDGSGNPLRWPPSAGFVHTVENGTRSPALNDVFLPRRKQILEQFLVDTCPGLCPVPVEPGAGVLTNDFPDPFEPLPEPPPPPPPSTMTLAGKPMVH